MKGYKFQGLEETDTISGKAYINYTVSREASKAPPNQTSYQTQSCVKRPN